MENNDLASAKISGVGTISGGRYSTVVISGSGKVTGGITSDTIKVSGTGYFTGDINSRELRVSGACTCEGNVKVDEINISGAFKALKDIISSKITLSGSMRSNGVINTEEMIANVWGCTFNEICGNIVSIVSKHRQATVKQIEATNIKLTNVKCERISGQHVIIGKKCVIDVVEYSEDLYISNGAKINTIIKI